MSQSRGPEKERGCGWVLDLTAWERAPFAGLAARLAGLLGAHVGPCACEDPADEGRAAEEYLWWHMV